EPDWARVELWWGDDRCVPPDDERSNYRMAKEALLDRLQEPPAAVHRMRGELGPDEGAAEYAREIAGVGTFDLLLLGLGPDGHAPSFLPTFPAGEVNASAVVGTESGLEPFVDRITFTLPRLSDTRAMLFLVTGGDKADAAARVFGGEPSPAAPASLMRS